MAGGEGEGETELRWEVTSELIDLDRWGRAVVEVTRRRREERSSPIVTHAFWIITALTLAMFALTRIVAFLVWSVATVLAAVAAAAWNRGAAQRLTRKLRAVPAASEPFTFVADRRGTWSTAVTGSDTIAWSRYRDVLLLDDLFVLVLDTEVVRLLPNAALASGDSAELAFATTRSWLTESASRDV